MTEIYEGELLKLTDILYEMSNLDSDDTGIDGYYIWISPKGNAKHGCRIKVTEGQHWTGKYVSIPILDPKVIGDDFEIPADKFKQICAWITLNQKLLQEFWDGKISSSKKVLNKLDKLPNSRRAKGRKV